MGWVDADAHVVESPLTWDYLTPSEKKFRPQLFKPEDDNQKAHWVIDGKIRGLFRFTFSKDDLDKKSAEIGRDVVDDDGDPRSGRRVGADQAYGRARASISRCSTPASFSIRSPSAPIPKSRCAAPTTAGWPMSGRQSNGRLRWMARLPLLSMADALDQLKFAKDNGGCGVFMRAPRRRAADQRPLLFSDVRIGREAELLHWPAPGQRQRRGGGHDGQPGRQPRFFQSVSDIQCRRDVPHPKLRHPAEVPKLRFGFIETAASWVPWVIYELRRRLDTVNKKLPNDLLERSGIFVTCQIGDDVPYLIKSCMGENTLMIGTDYGHADSSDRTGRADDAER